MPSASFDVGAVGSRAMAPLPPRQGHRWSSPLVTRQLHSVPPQNLIRHLACAALTLPPSTDPPHRQTTTGGGVRAVACDRRSSRAMLNASFDVAAVESPAMAPLPPR